MQKLSFWLHILSRLSQDSHSILTLLLLAHVLFEHLCKICILNIMAEATANSSAFPLFSRLPRELRDQIWRNALPDKVGPALYIYKTRSWCFRWAQTNQKYQPNNDGPKLNLEFRYNLFDVHEFEVALFFVRHEARGIGLVWARTHGVKVLARKNSEFPIFVCPFNPTRDAMYIPANKWTRFLEEPKDMCPGPDLLEKLVNVKPAHVTHLAVSRSLLEHKTTGAAFLAGSPEAVVSIVVFSFLSFGRLDA